MTLLLCGSCNLNIFKQCAFIGADVQTPLHFMCWEGPKKKEMVGLGEAWLCPTDDEGKTSLDPSLHCLLETALSDGGKKITGLGNGSVRPQPPQLPFPPASQGSRESSCSLVLALAREKG